MLFRKPLTVLKLDLARATSPDGLSSRQRAVLGLAVALIGALFGIGAGSSAPAEAASFHCPHKVQNGVWSWTYRGDDYYTYTRGGFPIRHVVSPETEYVTMQICDLAVRPDRMRIISNTYCLTDQNHSILHTGATFNPYFKLGLDYTNVNPVAAKVEEDGSPEHKCERHDIARSKQRWFRWMDRPYAKMITTQNQRLLGEWNDSSRTWRTSDGSSSRRMYRSAVGTIGVFYWPGY